MSSNNVHENTLLQKPLSKRLMAYITFQDKNAFYHSMILIPFILIVMFKVYPCLGLVLAFRRFSPTGDMFGQYWVGLRYFRQVFADPLFVRAIRNNVILSLLGDLISYPLPILFALLLNEMRQKKTSRVIQTISYLPHFLSTVVVAGIIYQLTSPTVGIINNVIRFFGGESINFLMRPGWFRPIYIISGIWQGLGWSAIIYIAAISGVDPQLYESAIIDGAGRFRQAIHVTIPCILPTIVITMILNIGNFLSIGHEKIILLYNPATYETADVISSYVYRIGLQQASFSVGTAIGLAESVVSIILVVSANAVARRVSENSLW